MNSPQITSPLDKSFNHEFNNRINSLHTSLIDQFESLPKTTSSLEQIFPLIPTIFRFLRQILQSQEKLFNEYNDLTNTTQQVISLCTQYIHDRHEHENELLLLKDQISQLIGRIGHTQYRLEHYWTMISSLEQEIERLQILLNHPQLLQISREKFQALQQTQKIQRDRLIKENESIKVLINKRKDSIKSIQTQIEIDVEGLQQLQSILYDNELEQKDVVNHWSQIERQTDHLQTIIEKTETMENEYDDRLRTTKFQYDLVQKQLNSLTSAYGQANKKLSVIQTNETNIKQEIENVKKEITTEQTRSFIRHDQIQNLQHQTHKLEQAKRHTHHLLKSAEHTNSLLAHQRLSLEHNQLNLQDRTKNFIGQLTDVIKQNQTNEQIISTNMLQLEHQQHQISTMEKTLENIIQFNNHLENILRENRFVRISEQGKLRSIKQLSYQKRKQLIAHTQRLRTLSRGEHRLANRTIRNVVEIHRLNTIFHHFNTNEKNLHENLRRKKTKLMSLEKQRAALGHSFRDHENNIHFLTKKSQLVGNELENKIDHAQFLQLKSVKQKHDRMLLLNQKQLCIYSSQQKAQKLDEVHRKYDQVEIFSDNEINHIINKIEENEQLKFKIHYVKKQISEVITGNKRHMDECVLLHGKISLYSQVNDMIKRQQQQCTYHITYLSRRVLHQQEENKRLSRNVQDLQKKSMITISSHYNKILREQDLSSRIFTHQQKVVQNSPTRARTQKTLRDYSTLVNRLMKIIYQCVQWREKLVWINQRYFTKIEQIHRQTSLLEAINEMNLRDKINLEIKQCKAMKAEFRLQTLSLSFEDNVS